MEEGEVDFAVVAVLDEVREGAEVVVAAVLHDDEGSGLHHWAVEYHARQVGELRQVVGGVGKDDVKLLSARGYESKHVALDDVVVVATQRAADLLDEIELRGGFLDRCHRGTFPRQELEADGTSARKQVEHLKSLKVNKISQDIEDIFARHVGCGACCYVGGHVKASSPVFSANYTHSASKIRSNGAFIASCPSRIAAAG